MLLRGAAFGIQVIYGLRAAGHGDAQVGGLSGVAPEMQIQEGGQEMAVGVVEPQGVPDGIGPALENVPGAGIGLGRRRVVGDVVAAALVDLNDRVDEISGATPQIDLSGYTPTSGFSTINGSAITNGGNLVIQSPDMSGYYTSGQTDTAIATATQDMVSSTYISTIWKGTQAQYDAIVTKDPDTFYIIVNSN